MPQLYVKQIYMLTTKMLKMNNQADTEYAIDDANEYTNIKVSIKFTQKNA